MASKVVTFLSDFGTRDSYVAEVKAVLLGAKSTPVLVDITHEVPPFDIRWGAFQLLRAYSYFPKGTVHLAIVDPGVGTTRRAVHVKTRDYHFVGPDNGLLLWAVRDCERREKKAAQVFEIEVPAKASITFHGRDLFAPFIAAGLKPAKKSAPLAGKDIPLPRAQGRKIHGEILGADHYGNLVTNIPHDRKQRVEREAENYLAIKDGQVGLIRGSHGYWELARREGSAAASLKLKPGDAVSISLL